LTAKILSQLLQEIYENSLGFDGTG